MKKKDEKSIKNTNQKRNHARNITEISLQRFNLFFPFDDDIHVFVCVCGSAVEMEENEINYLFKTTIHTKEWRY